MSRISSRWRRRLLVLAFGVVALLVIGTAAYGFYFSHLLITPDHDPGPYDERVTSVGARTVTLERSPDATRPGVYGLLWPEGHAIVGEVTSEAGGRVVRRLRERSGPLRAGTKVEITNDVYAGDPGHALGIPFRSVEVPSPLGGMPAWRVPGRGRTWAIYVHGYDGNRGDGLRTLPVLRGLRIPTLLISYRNDAGAPKGPGGKIHLGATEWRDLESAASYAVRSGARRLVLIGDSMGGGIVANFVRHSRLARRVRALVLNAPALSWIPILKLQAGERGVPAPVRIAAEWITAERIDVSWSDIDQLKHTGAFRVPILLFHGTDDATVPISTSEALARKLPRRVRFIRVRGATHVGAWNVGPSAFDRELRTFVERVLRGRPGRR